MEQQLSQADGNGQNGILQPF